MNHVTTLAMVLGHYSSNFAFCLFKLEFYVIRKELDVTVGANVDTTIIRFFF